MYPCPVGCDAKVVLPPAGELMRKPMPMLPISQPNAMLYCSGWTMSRVTSAAIGPSVAPKNPVMQNITNSPGMECIRPQQNMEIAEIESFFDHLFCHIQLGGQGLFQRLSLDLEFRNHQYLIFLSWLFFHFMKTMNTEKYIKHVFQYKKVSFQTFLEMINLLILSNQRVAMKRL